MLARLLIFSVFVISPITAKRQSIKPQPSGKFKLCTKSSKQLEEAIKLYKAFDREISEENSPTQQQRTLFQFSELINHPCFEMHKEDNRTFKPETYRVLKDWWERGGNAWLQSYLFHNSEAFLEQDEQPSLEDQIRYPKHFELVIAPDMDIDLTYRRNALDNATNQLLCSEANCGAATQGWKYRVEDLLSRVYTTDKGFSEKKECSFQKSKSSVTDYLRFRKCLIEHRRLSARFPFGEFRAPESGWIIIRGRRGHYSFCDGIAAFSLVDGSAYIARSCSHLHLTLSAPTSVNYQKTEDGRSWDFLIGRVNLSNLRELAWLLIVQDHLNMSFQRSRKSEYLPEGVLPRIHEANLSPIPKSKNVRYYSSSSQTMLAWNWQQDRAVITSGELIWGGFGGKLNDYIVDLLIVAEYSLEHGCPATRLGENAFSEKNIGTVSSIDAQHDTLTRVHRQLEEQLRQRASEVCKLKSN